MQKLKEFKLPGDEIVIVDDLSTDKQIKNPLGNHVKIMPGFNPEFKDKINFENLKINDTTKNFCKPSDKECAQFVNDISTDIGYIGNAWNAYGLDTKIGPRIYSSFKGIDTNNIQNIIKYLFLFLNILVALALLISYLALYIPPDKLWVPSIFSLVFPIFVLINFIFIINAY